MGRRGLKERETVLFNRGKKLSVKIASCNVGVSGTVVEIKSLFHPLMSLRVVALLQRKRKEADDQFRSV